VQRGLKLECSNTSGLSSRVAAQQLVEIAVADAEVWGSFRSHFLVTAEA
jgi:hypothetical protein